MSTWPTVELGKVATIDRTAVFPVNIAASTPYVGLENIERGGAITNVATVGESEISSTKFRFTEQQVLFGKLRPYLAKISRPNFCGVCSTDILPISPGADLDKGYLCHFLSLPDTVALATSRASGANLPRLAPKELAKFQIPLPPITEQRRIARLLDSVDTLRTKRRKATALLDDLAQSIFLDMFGDPQENPHSWPTTTLSRVVDQDDRINYGVVQPGDDNNDGIPLIRVGDLIDGRVDRSTIKRIDPNTEAKYSRSRLRGNEILVGCVGSIGSIALASEADIGSNIARAVARIPISSDAQRAYVVEHLRSTSVQHYFTSELRTVAQPTLNIKQLSQTIIMAPPYDLQAEFVSLIASVDALRHGHLLHLANLDALFASLQHHAFHRELWDAPATQHSLPGCLHNLPAGKASQ